MKLKINFAQTLVMGGCVSLAIIFTMPAFATDQDNAELGIEMKKNQSSATVSETLAKSNKKLRSLEKAKADVSEALTGKPNKTVPSAPKKAIEPMLGARPFRLKNGKTLEGVIQDRDSKGVWVETEPGVKIYLKNDEIVEDKD